MIDSHYEEVGPLFTTDLAGPLFTTDLAGPLFTTDLAGPLFTTDLAGPLFTTDLVGPLFTTDLGGPLFTIDLGDLSVDSVVFHEARVIHIDFIFYFPTWHLPSSNSVSLSHALI